MVTRARLDAELAREVLCDYDCANAIDLTVPTSLSRCSKRRVEVSIGSIRESFATMCANVRRLNLVGHSIRTKEDIEPLRKLLFLYYLKLQAIDGQFANPVCRLPGYRKMVCEDVCEGRLLYLDGVKVGNAGTSMLERALEKVRSDVSEYETERRMNEKGKISTGGFRSSQCGEAKHYMQCETAFGVRLEIQNEQTEKVTRIFSRFDAVHAVANELHERIGKSLRV